MIIIPTQTDVPRYTMRVNLDGTKFFLAFEWNDRDAAWFLDVSTTDELPLVSGIKIVVGFPLLNRYRDPRLPNGTLEAIDTADRDLDPAFADLGERVLLCFTPVSEMPPELVITI